MKLKLIYILLTVILFLVLYLMKSQIIGLFFSSKEKQSVESIAKKYSSKVEISLKDDFEKIVEYFSKVKGNFSHYKYWWSLKKRNIRSLIEHKHYQLAYTLLSLHQNEEVADRIDAEW